MKVHLVAICGTGMGSLAGLLAEAGHQVRGSDRAFYPPMSERLKAWGIPTLQGFDPAHLEADCDLVVVGNACRKDNPEARAAYAKGLRVVSFPQALSEMFIGGRESIVVAGTHGKTSTSALLAYLLVAAGRDPSFLIGGIANNFQKSFRLGQGAQFVVEGDEYDSAFFDKRPKFMHYRPKIAVLTSVEFDHADIYSDMDAYRGAFRSFVDLLDEDGLLVACIDDPEVRDLSARARCRVVSYGFTRDARLRATDIVEGREGVNFRCEVGGEGIGRIAVPLSGRHNLANTLAVIGVADALGIPPNTAAPLFTGYQGVARRMQARGEAGGVLVIDDFAHHPTAVRETIWAARRRYPQAFLVAVFEPRTNTSRRRIFQDSYAQSFGEADQVILVPPFNPEQIPEMERFDSAELVAALKEKGQEAVFLAGSGAVIEYLCRSLPSGSVVLIMSNGAFDDIHAGLLAALRRRESDG